MFHLMKQVMKKMANREVGRGRMEGRCGSYG